MFEDIEIFDKKKSHELFNLYSVTSDEINNEIKNKLLSFQSSPRFFEHYTKKNINQLLSSLSEFNANLSELFEENQNIFDQQTDKYISNLSKIYIALNLIHKVHEILAKILELTKNYYSNLISENKIKIINANSINEYINELIVIYSNKNINLFTPKFSNGSSPDNEKTTSLNYFSNKENVNFTSFFKNKNKSQFNKELDLFSKSTKSSEVENQNQNQIKIINDPEEVDFKYEGHFSLLSLKEMKFVEPEETSIDKKNTLRKIHSLNPRSKILSSKKNKKNKMKSISENDHNKEMCRILLEAIIDLYKNCLINSEEKLKLKRLIISKSNKIKQIYVDYFIQCRYDKNVFISELKKNIK